jgi:pyruvate dehydrogenase E2 component (dihydrolipoamide acetyltransferase)
VATEVKLPRLGQGMESGTIVRWLKSEGEQVAKGEPLYELDTDKVTQEVEAEATGVLLKIAVSEGEVEVGRTIGFIGKEGESVAAVEAPAPTQVSETETVSDTKKAPERVQPQTTNGRVKASPLAREPASTSQACKARVPKAASWRKMCSAHRRRLPQSPRQRRR